MSLQEEFTADEAPRRRPGCARQVRRVARRSDAPRRLSLGRDLRHGLRLPACGSGRCRAGGALGRRRYSGHGNVLGFASGRLAWRGPSSTTTTCCSTQPEPARLLGHRERRDRDPRPAGRPRWTRGAARALARRRVGEGDRPPRPEREREDDVDAPDRRRPGGCGRHRHGARPVRGRLPCSARVGYQTQAPSVYADLTCARTSTTSPPSSTSPTTASPRVIELVELAGRETQLAVTLSGGERARLSLAAAILNRPSCSSSTSPRSGSTPSSGAASGGRSSAWLGGHDGPSSRAT